MVKYLAVLEIILKVMNKKLFMYLLLNNSLPEDSPSKEAESEDKKEKITAVQEPFL